MLSSSNSQTCGWNFRAHSRLYVWQNAPLTLPGFALLPLKSAATALESQNMSEKHIWRPSNCRWIQTKLSSMFLLYIIYKSKMSKAIARWNSVCEYHVMYQIYSTISILLYSDGFYFAQVSIYSTSPQHILFGQIAVLPLACTSQSFSKEWATTSFCALHQGHPLLWLASTRLLQKLLQLSRSLEEYRSRRVVPGYSHTAFFSILFSAMGEVKHI